MVEIPTTNLYPAFDQFVDIDGTRYLFDFKYIERSDSWVFSIFDSLSNPIIQNIPLNSGYSLLEQYNNAELPNGQFLALHETDNSINAGRFDLGDSVRLYYVSF